MINETNSKKEIMAFLDKEKIEYPEGLNKSELLALVPADKLSKPEVKKSAGVAGETIRCADVMVAGAVLRTFSDKIHGEEYESLANDFAKKHSTDARKMKVVLAEREELSETQEPVDEDKYADVVGPMNGVVRTYTLNTHGENYEELAKEFSGKTPRTTVRLR